MLRRIPHFRLEIALLLCFTPIAGASSVTLEIAGSDSRQFVSIQEAINEAPANSTVRIAEGRYEENLVITSPLTLAGPGWDKATVGLLRPKTQDELTSLVSAYTATSKSSTSREDAARRYYNFMDAIYPPALIVKSAGDVTVTGLRFTLLPQHNAPLAKLPISEQILAPVNAVFVTTSTVTMNDCAVIGTVTDGIVAGSGSIVKIDHCLVAGIYNDGVRFSSSSTGSVTNSDIRACYHYGIAIGPHTKDVLVENCRISDTAWHGIRLDDCRAIIRNNRLHSHARCGLYVSGATTAEITNNIIYKCGSGISFWYKSRDSVHKNTFAECETGISLISGPTPEIKQNLFYQNKAGVTRGSVTSPFAEGAPPVLNVNHVSQSGVGKEQLAWTSDSIFTQPNLRSDLSLELADDTSTFGARGVAPIASPFPTQPEETTILPTTASRSWKLWSPPYKAEIMSTANVPRL